MGTTIQMYSNFMSDRVSDSHINSVIRFMESSADLFLLFQRLVRRGRISNYETAEFASM